MKEDPVDSTLTQMANDFTSKHPQGLPAQVKHKSTEVLHDYSSDSLYVYLNNNEIINRPLHIKAVGMTFRKNGMQILEDLKTHFKPQDIMVMLKREPTNKHDKNAIQIYVGVKHKDNTYHIGYIPKTSSEFYAFILDSGKYKITTSNVEVVGGGYDTNFGLHFIATITYR